MILRAAVHDFASSIVVLDVKNEQVAMAVPNHTVKRL